MMGDLTENFSKSEFRCPCGCGSDNISRDLIVRLQMVRMAYNKPIHINSGVRCPEHNKEVGGVEDSEHVPVGDGPGEGADLQCDNGRDRYELLIRLVHKFDRIGIGTDFIHVGVRETKPREVVWLYP